MTDEMALSLVKCFFVALGIAIANKAVAGVLKLFGTSSPTNEIVAFRVSTFVFLVVTVGALVASPSPVVNSCLFILFVGCIGAGDTVAEFLHKRHSDNLLPGPVKWVAVVLLFGTMALVVGNGYPANPLATIELVELMKDPFAAMALCGIAAAFGYVLNSTKDRQKRRATH